MRSYQGPLPGTTEWKKMVESPEAIAGLVRAAAFAMSIGAGLIQGGATDEEEDEQDASTTKTNQSH